MILCKKEAVIDCYTLLQECTKVCEDRPKQLLEHCLQMVDHFNTQALC
jgi:hypothetical protein